VWISEPSLSLGAGSRQSANPDETTAVTRLVIKSIANMNEEELVHATASHVRNSARYPSEALVFVHGFNVSFDNALRRAAQIAYDLNFDGPVFVFSWPSRGQAGTLGSMLAIRHYPYDRESADEAVQYFVDFLKGDVAKIGAKKINLIAHSMGNKPLLDVLKDMKSAVPKGVVVSQIILAAPDVDINIFTNLAQQIKGLARGVTLYASANDRALLVSRSVWHHYRAGDIPATGPLIVKGIDTIDVTAASTDVFALNHSDYAQNTDLLTDIGKLIVTGLRPPDVRFNKLKPVNPGKNEYWRYVPGQPPAVETGTP